MPVQLRPNNRALEYLIQHYQKSVPKVEQLASALAAFAWTLYAEAQENAKNLLTPENESALGKVTRQVIGTRKETLLANCILDLQLSVCFGEFSKYLGNSEAASLVVDALLYQATGLEASSPSEEEILLGTQNARGIHKFQLGKRKMPHIATIESWMFGKEYGAIKFDNPMNIGNIFSVSSFAFATRVEAFWAVRYFLCGVAPTERDRQKLREDLVENDKQLTQMMEKLSRPSTEQ